MIKKLFSIIRNNNDGFTLIELIVSFTLLSIFLTMACTMLTSYTRIYSRISTMAFGENVAEQVLSTIEDCLDDSSDVTIRNDLLYLDEHNVMETNYIMQYRTKNGNKATIYAFNDNDKENNGILKLYYMDKDDGPVLPDTNTDKSKIWSLSDAAYMNYRISVLYFRPEDKNRLSVTVEVKNNQTGSSVKRKRIIECYNLSPSSPQIKAEKYTEKPYPAV